MTSTIHVLKESLLFTSDSTSRPIDGETVAVSAAPNVVWINIPRVISPIDGEFEDIDDIANASENDDVKRPAVQRARRTVAERFTQGALGLAYLRLQRGWSQKYLAEQLGTSQSHVARMEMGNGDEIKMNTIRRLAHALGVSVADIDAALLARRES